VVTLDEICEIRDFIVLPHCLGKGAFAEVHLGLWPKMCMQVACKTVKVKGKKSHRITLSMAADGMRKSRRSSEWEKMLKERDILMNLSHVSRSPP
jgi:serine/threonine protein kinase